MANPLSSIFAAVVKSVESVATVVDTAASATDAGMKAVNLHATEYYKRVEYDYRNDFEAYKVERDNYDSKRLIDAYEERTKLAQKVAELKDVPLESLEDLDALVKLQLDRASKL